MMLTFRVNQDDVIVTVRADIPVPGDVFNHEDVERNLIQCVIDNLTFRLRTVGVEEAKEHLGLIPRDVAVTTQRKRELENLAQKEE